MKKNIFMNLMGAFGLVLLLFTIILGSVFLMLVRNHIINMNRTSLEQKALCIAETVSSFQTGKGSGYGAYMKYLDELAMAEVWIVDEQLQIYSRGNGNHVVEYEQLPENAEYIVSLVFSGELTYGEDFSDTLGPTL